ncbi:MAG: hypothetical protein JW913_00960 [Chitinispirillaceae bacterium]|nr:hypothetical protein [Chitinispirillaceae bacterium]
MKSIASGMCLMISVVAAPAFSAPGISFSGYGDADVWGNFTGNYYANSELDLGMALSFSEKLSAHVYATVWSANGEHPGGIPARYAPPDERWLSVLFDGFDITYATKFGTFTAGDLVYQYGKFNYYFYKRLSMITTESFTRGLKYSIGNEMATQELLLGIADKNGSTSDVQGVTNIAMGKAHSVGFYYGMKNDAILDFSAGTDAYAGVEYLGSFGEALSVKADAGFMNLAGDKRSNVVLLLFEPVLTLGRFTTAFTGYVMIDNDTLINSASLLRLGDEMFFYLEPGYTFNDYVGCGLPIEYHAADMANENDNAVWVVPAIYIYPFEKIRWRIWGQVVRYMADSQKNDYGIGSEIIVTF